VSTPTTHRVQGMLSSMKLMHQEFAQSAVARTLTLLVFMLPPARAESVTPPQPGPSSLDAPRAVDGRPSDAIPYWSQGKARAFVSGGAIAGLGYGRLALASGYGKPHWIWAGLESSGYLSPFFASFQGGLHASAVIVDLSVNARHTTSFEYGRIAQRDSVSTAELNRNKDKATYDSLDTSLWGFVPYRGMLATWEITYTRPLSLDDSLLFEEVQRVVVGKQGAFTTKLAAMVQLPSRQPLYWGVLGEQLSLFGRTGKMVLRLGPSAWARIGDHWDLFGCLTLPVQSPDQLGLWNGSFGYLGVAYAFATGDQGSAPP